MKRCFQVDPADNVATLLDDAAAGLLTVYGAPEERMVCAVEAIALGHKVALEPIARSTPIIKYGVPIGLSTADIQPGQWVHLHNCRSQVDERSNHFDVRTGIAQDTPYA